ncbi:MAG: hypothetical protein ABSE59_11855, partial [Opitutaceae bacterium]
KLGARPMRDTVEKLIGDAVVVDLLTNGIGSGGLAVDEAGNHLVVRPSVPADSGQENCKM